MLGIRAVTFTLLRSAPGNEELPVSASRRFGQALLLVECDFDVNVRCLQPHENASFVGRQREADAIVLGETHMTEIANYVSDVMRLCTACSENTAGCELLSRHHATRGLTRCDRAAVIVAPSNKRLQPPPSSLFTA